MLTESAKHHDNHRMYLHQIGLVTDKVCSAHEIVKDSTDKNEYN